MSVRVTITTSDQLGQVLQGARKIAGLTQADAAARLAISQSRISHMELNPETISVSQLLALLGAYELDLVIEPRTVSDAVIERLDW
ncbi:MAG: XRE family transcriptional regulator [Cupriavidus sp.]|jgi:HTH-type transcriptional regulator/antitoxin HipB|uniref:helix-turn-helix domain-containing protein n=1 Tax=Cupriavidus pauculus TaxID=82633 RepID=UPI000784E346|nr:helix-turn-helix transcriptional regulator [Cupriavidus pauculus]MBU65269.1 XRE family transcriptional regulator [Cupriavidus sp.]KAB0603900.1 helix-turn-helix domain-containing protein [Cupriavidus pauculus]MBY4730198.1 helix-turn-helix domain-containing protein [Cupriavidus pauculus]MCM3607810.1 helix-turn-helix domain-containing protein [Cupriavidus pauculus]UAL03280.1 helix-turn-helix domain-containing protein [Cupriavidus pauculus]